MGKYFWEPKRPPYERFMSHYKDTVEKESIIYPPLRFEISSGEDEEDGVFIFGEERGEIFERYYDLSEALNFGEIRGLKSKIQSLIVDDPIFIGSHELMLIFDSHRIPFPLKAASFHKSFSKSDLL